MKNSDQLLKKISHSCKKLNANPFFMFENSTKNIFINNYSYLELKKQKVNFENFDNIFCDGSLLAFLASKKIGKKIERVSFDETSYAFEWIDRAMQEDMDILIIGASEDENQKFISQLKKLSKRNYKSIRGLSGYDLDINDIQISNNVPSLIIVGLGTPYQENLITLLSKKFRNKKNKLIFFSCGGFITQTSKSNEHDLSYYPRIINKFNLRWLYRFFNEKHTFKRTIFSYPISVINFILDERY